jgi:chromosome segregation ATPase
MPLPSGDLFPASKDPKIYWEELEKRIGRLLEGIVQLRNANRQLMNENDLLKKRARDAGGDSDTNSEELQKLRKQYAEALEDLKTVRKNLERMESLAGELKLGKKA